MIKAASQAKDKAVERRVGNVEYSLTIGMFSIFTAKPI
jgi:hypothetical protein